MAALLDWWETIKNTSMVSTVTTNRMFFFKFFLSVGGMLGREALVLLAQLSQTMAEKRDKTFLHVQGWINSRIKITVAGYYSRMIRRAQLPGPLQDREPYWYP